MPASESDTPPHSPGIPLRGEEDELYMDDVLEEVEVDENPDNLEEEDEDEGGGGSDDELLELPGGIDQLESILENSEKPEDNSKLVFTKHTNSVFCCCFHPEVDGLLASGGEDDIAYVWDSATGDVHTKVEGWNDSVLCSVWSSDGQHLAMCDMAGSIKVLKYPGYAEEWSFDVGDVLWMRWHPVANVLFCGTSDSGLWMWKIPSGDSKLFQGQGEKTECGAILADGKRAVCGYSDGSIRVFDLKSGSAQHTMSQGIGHVDIVNSVDCHLNNTLIATGSMDGSVKLWNSTTGKCVGTLLCGSKVEENSPSSVECCVFPKDKSSTLCVTGSLDGVVSVWDTPTQISRASCKVGEGVTKVVLHPHDPLVYASTLDGAVRCLDLRSGTSVAEYTGHTASVLDFTISASGCLLASSSDDKTCRIFDIRNNQNLST